MTASVSELPLTSFVPQFYRPSGHLSTWSGHLAFAHDLIAAIRPSLIIELGTHYGESYFTFCQTIAENALDCKAYAVDHWAGDTHSGFYDDAIFHKVREFNDSHYRQFSNLLRMSFDDALQQFNDNSIDLLHIDGFHTYEAASHDFTSWLPKVRPGGIVLIHDIAATHAHFGVWRLWEQLKQEFSDTFEFDHCWGLGVVRKPGVSLGYPGILNLLFQSSQEIQERVRNHYVTYASRLEAMLWNSPQTEVKIYPFGESGYSEETALTQKIDIGSAETLSFYLPRGLGDGPLRIDPASTPCIVEIKSIQIRDADSNELLWESSISDDLFQDLTVAGSAKVLQSNDRPTLLISYGHDPQMILPTIKSSRKPVRVILSLRLDLSYASIYAELKPRAEHTVDSINEMSSDAEPAITDRESEIAKSKELMSELRASQSERMIIEAELKQAIFDRQSAERELRRLEKDFDAAQRDLRQARIASLSQELESPAGNLQSAIQESQELRQRVERSNELLELAHTSAKELQQRVDALENALEEERRIRTAMLQSFSWRITEPGRRFMRVLRTAVSRR